MGFIIQTDPKRLMKLLFIAPSAYLLGGVQDWLFMLTIGLRERGYDIKVAIPNNHYHNGVIYNNFYLGIDAIYFTNKTGTFQGRVKALYNLIVNNPSDIIVGVNIGDLYAAFQQAANCLSKTRIVMTLHAIEGEYLGDIGKYSRLLDGVITTNKLTQKIVTKLDLIDRDRVFYAPYGVKANKSVIKECGGDMLRIAWVGRLDNKQKRISDLPDILRSLDEKNVSYALSIAGDGPYRESLEHDLRVWIGRDQVRILGFLDKNALDLFYRSHDILLITSEWETGPIVAWEAMLSGLVVVSSEYVGSSSEGALMNEVTALLFPVGSNEVAASQISRLSETHFRESLSRNGRRMALSRYSFDSSLDSWDKAFSTILASAPRRREAILKKPLIENAGRLDFFLGPSISELLRKFLEIKGYCRDPGSEWPHSYYKKVNSQALLKYAKSLDQNA
jgi:glycosyltransferase involved in cell wall biosynthesis